ncbi:MAG: hypothetical protein DMG21_19045 [Acidobacteria bacterium]|nr:MAG: hypothetical protein DMG21_19045 [Acidobacteriota bacterium]
MDFITESNSELDSALFVEVLHAYGMARLRVNGASMLPSIWPGDILEVRRPGEVKIASGELVLFERGGRFFAHRVVGMVEMPMAEVRDAREPIRKRDGSLKPILQRDESPSRTFLVTRGDRQRRSDPPISPEELLGRVTAIVRGNRRIAPRRRWWGRVASWVLCRSDLCTRIVLRCQWAVARR